MADTSRVQGVLKKFFSPLEQKYYSKYVKPPLFDIRETPKITGEAYIQFPSGESYVSATGPQQDLDTVVAHELQHVFTGYGIAGAPPGTAVAIDKRFRDAMQDPLFARRANKAYGLSKYEYTSPYDATAKEYLSMLREAQGSSQFRGMPISSLFYGSVKDPKLGQQWRDLVESLLRYQMEGP